MTVLNSLQKCTVHFCSRFNTVTAVKFPLVAGREGCLEGRVIVIGLVVISEQASCVDKMVAEQEVEGLLCEDVRFAAILAEKRQTLFEAGGLEACVHKRRIRRGGYPDL